MNITGDVLSFPVAFPEAQFSAGAAFEYNEDEPVFDAKIHLDIRAPETVTLLDASTVPIDSIPAASAGRSHLAFTTPFQLLSAEGMLVIRRIVAREQQHAQTSARLAQYLRFLAYRSRWVRDFNRAPEVLALFSRLAGQELMAHSMPSNYSHANIGVVGSSKNVDHWHVDSVPFVVVILITDMAGSTGGNLELIKNLPPTQAFQLLADTSNQVPPEHLLTVNYPGPGAAVFMQGSLIAHHVTPV